MVYNIVIAHNEEDVFSFTGVNNFTMKHEVCTYPNPVKANTALSFIFSENQANQFDVEWLDVCGKIISKEEGILGSSIATPDVEPGVYLLKIINSNKAVTKKILVE